MATDHKGQKKILFNGLAASVRYEIFIFIGRRLAELEMWTLLAKVGGYIILRSYFMHCAFCIYLHIIIYTSIFAE